MTEHATAEDFKNWSKNAKSLTVEELRHVIEDCRQASEAMKGWNPVKEMYYRDQMLTYSEALRKKIGA